MLGLARGSSHWSGFATQAVARKHETPPRRRWHLKVDCCSYLAANVSLPRTSRGHPTTFKVQTSCLATSTRATLVRMPAASEILEQVFREEYGRIVATLIRLSGSFDLAEES